MTIEPAKGLISTRTGACTRMAPATAALAIERTDGRAASHWADAQGLPSAADHDTADVVGNTFAASMVVVAGTILTCAWFATIGDNGIGVTPDDPPLLEWSSPLAIECSPLHEEARHERRGLAPLASITGLDEVFSSALLSCRAHRL